MGYGDWMEMEGFFKNLPDELQGQLREIQNARQEFNLEFESLAGAKLSPNENRLLALIGLQQALRARERGFLVDLSFELHERIIRRLDDSGGAG